MPTTSQHNAVAVTTAAKIMTITPKNPTSTSSRQEPPGPAL
jgi:hypothetical protein